MIFVTSEASCYALGTPCLINTNMPSQDSLGLVGGLHHVLLWGSLGIQHPFLTWRESNILLVFRRSGVGLLNSAYITYSTVVELQKKSRI